MTGSRHDPIPDYLGGHEFGRRHGLFSLRPPDGGTGLMTALPNPFVTDIDEPSALYALSNAESDPDREAGSPDGSSAEVSTDHRASARADGGVESRHAPVTTGSGLVEAGVAPGPSDARFVLDVESFYAAIEPPPLFLQGTRR